MIRKDGTRVPVEVDGRIGCDAVMACEDWGTQQQTLVSRQNPALDPLIESGRAARLQRVKIQELPVVGVPLPLISYGGTSIVTLLAAFGILMSIHGPRNFIR